ncbi:conserved transmembrane domain protein [Mycobacterium ulcerans str. Harvey]|uniref:Conserved transmembrane domain protein n=1 Tax=Mycobacterium ulcerans str. Harvey TaxID=1299332 RepID=A0ABN0R339_MYCUL|nr:conserved transmembrane domain protein [Mycobacterium ulcerans str. Harvey]
MVPAVMAYPGIPQGLLADRHRRLRRDRALRLVARALPDNHPAPASGDDGRRPAEPGAEATPARR